MFVLFGGAFPKKTNFTEFHNKWQAQSESDKATSIQWNIHCFVWRVVLKHKEDTQIWKALGFLGGKSICGRCSNATRYQHTLLVGSRNDPMCSQEFLRKQGPQGCSKGDETNRSWGWINKWKNKKNHLPTSVCFLYACISFRYCGSAMRA